MSRVSSLGQASALALLIGSGAASADVTSAEVWKNFKSLLESNGNEVSVGSLDEGSDAVVIQNLITEMTLNEDDQSTSTTATLSEMTFKDLGDGRVEITMSPDYRIVSSVKESDGDVVDTSLSMSHEDMKIIVSGTPEAMAYDFTSKSVTFSVDSLAVEGEEVDGTINAVMSGLSGRTFIEQTEGNFTSKNNMAAEAIAMKVDMAEPEGDSAFKLDVTYQGVLMSSDGRLPEDMSSVAIVEALKDGTFFKGDLAYQSSSFDMAVEDVGENFNFTGTSGPGVLNFNLSADGTGYNAKAFQVKMNVAGDAIPLPPVDIALEEVGFGLSMPVMASDTPQDFSMNIVTRDLVLPESLWSLFDPGSVLSRDPATFALDVSGKVKFLVDIMDGEAMEAASDAPAELEELSLKNLELSLAGTSLTGEGSFTFDNTDMDTFDGLPKPEGAVNLKLVGGNGLMENLIEMGLFPAEQAMGVRMMIGMFARPEGDDTLVSEIGIKDGKFLANGQPLPF